MKNLKIEVVRYNPEVDTAPHSAFYEVPYDATTSLLDALGYIKDNLSKYAMTNLKEFVAEAWSEYLNNPNPRELASHVGEMIKAEYEARYKKSGE